jgi:hypothetical protein
MNLQHIFVLAIPVARRMRLAKEAVEVCGCGNEGM